MIPTHNPIVYRDSQSGGEATVRDPEKPRFRRMHLAFCALFLGISLVGCQSAVVDTSTPSPFTEELRPTPTLPLEADEATIGSTTMVPTTPSPFTGELTPKSTLPLETREATIEPITVVPTTPAKPSPTPPLDTPTPISDDAYQLTSMNAGEPWWSEDGRTLYFSTIGPDSERWSIDLATNAIQPAPDILSSYRRAISLTASLIPDEVFQYYISVSPSGGWVIFPRQVAPTEPAEEFCDGEACFPIPANEIWVIDVESKQLTQLRMEGELTAMEINFLWSDNKSRVVIGVSPFWATGSDTPTVWIADLSSERVYPMGARDDRISRGSISPNGDFVTYRLKKSEPGPDSCDMYLWIVDSQEERLLPGLLCTPHFWLSDNRTIVFTREVGRRILFFTYDTTTSERRAVASSATLPSTACWYVLAPDERSVAVVPYAAFDPSGIWLVRFEFPIDD